MADIMPTLLAFPPDKKKLSSAKEYDAAITSHVTAIKKLSVPAFTKEFEGKSVIELLDPQANSASYLLALLYLIELSGKDQTRIIQCRDFAYAFMASFDPIQVRYMGEQWAGLFGWLLTHAATSQPTNLMPLVDALLRLDPSAGTFTIHHLHLVGTALTQSVPSQVLPILDKHIYAFPQKSTRYATEDLLAEENELSNTFITEKSGFSSKILPEHVLEYYLLSALVYIGQRNWSRARLFLEYILLTPSQQHTTSLFQVEAYKKWLLIGPLSYGKQFPVPRTMDQAVIKNIKLVAKNYEALSDDFEKRDYKKYIADASAGEDGWKMDGNHRLVEEVGHALMRNRVADLQKTYAALPVSRLASHIDLEVGATITLLTDMIQSGHLKASLSSGDSTAVLRFVSTSADSEHPLQQDLETQTIHIHTLVNYIRDADRRLQLTKEYVDHQKRIARSGGPDGDMADMMDLTWDNPIITSAVDDDGDEDIMS